MWSKNDDQNHAAPSIMGSWWRCRAAVGLHFMAESYSGAYGTDGIIDPAFVIGKLPDQAERADALEALCEAGLWRPMPDGSFEIIGYLDRNPSAEHVRARRVARAAAGRAGADSRWNR